MSANGKQSSIRLGYFFGENDHVSTIFDLSNQEERLALIS